MNLTTKLYELELIKGISKSLRLDFHKITYGISIITSFMYSLNFLIKNNTQIYMKPIKETSKRYTIRLRIIIFSTLSIFMCQCSMYDEIITESKDSVSPVTRAVFDNEFDWDKVDRISLFNPNIGQAAEVELPWIKGSTSSYGIPASWLDENAFSTNFSERYYSRENGWNLVYSNLTSTSAAKYFALYNKYTGILRFFFYTLSNASGNGSTCAFWGLNINKPSSLFNFTYDYAKIITEKTTNPSYITSTPGVYMAEEFIGKGYIVNNWYGFEIECAYDPDIIQGSGYNFELLGWAVNKTKTEGEGKTEGSITGTISYISPNGSPNLSLNNMFNKSEANRTIIGDENNIAEQLGNKIEEGVAQNDSFFKGLWNKIKQGSDAGIKDGAKKVLSKALATGGSAAIKVFGKLTNSVLGIGGNSKPSTASVDLRIKSMTDFTFESETRFPGWGGITQFPIPGSSTNNYDKPIYNKPLGVWNLGKTPIINIEGIARRFPDGPINPEKGIYKFTYFIDCKKDDIILNDEIKNLVTIEDFKVELAVEEGSSCISPSGKHISNYGPEPTALIKQRKYYSKETMGINKEGILQSIIHGNLFIFNDTFRTWDFVRQIEPVPYHHGTFKAIISFQLVEKATGNTYYFSRWFDVKFGSQKVNYQTILANRDMDYERYIDEIIAFGYPPETGYKPSDEFDITTNK